MRVIVYVTTPFSNWITSFSKKLKKTPLDRKEISCPYALYEDIRIIVYLQNLNTFHIWFLLHYKLRYLYVEALGFRQNGRLNVNGCRQSNRWGGICLIIILFLIISIDWIFEHRFAVLDRFLCLKTLIYDKLFTWDQQELKIYYYRWNNFSLYNTFKKTFK